MQENVIHPPPDGQAHQGLFFVNQGGFAQTASRMAFALREWWTERRLHWHLGGIAAAAVAFAVLGPFGTWDRYPPLIRFAYWSFGIGTNWIFALTVIPAGVSVCVRHGISEWAGVAAGCVLAALPGTGAITFLNGLMGEPFQGASTLGERYLQVLLVHALLGSLAYGLIERPIRRRRQQEETSDSGTGLPHSTASLTAPSESPADALLDSLPANLGRELLRLQMKDHYVEVHTPLGHALVLMRFRDALRSVRDLDGMQVHRSHWVARRAVAGVEQGNGRTQLRLRDGQRIPVSRSFLPSLRAAGWLSDATRGASPGGSP